MSLADRVKPYIRSLAPYVPGKPIEELERELGVRGSIKLASNENPLGPSPRAVEAMRRAAAEIHRYPDGASFALRAALSKKLGVAGDQLVFAWPSFAMYPIVVQGMGATGVPVPLTRDLVHDLDAMLAAIGPRTRVVMICNPNNPTGTSVGAEAFDRFVAALPPDVVLAVDEAYYEFVRRPDFPDAIALTARRPGTVILRTFSKIYGLAGIRIGYGICDRELASYLERARHPFNVNRLAEVAALAALEDDEHYRRTREINATGAVYLTNELARLGIETWPTDANFILARTGADVYDALLAQGVIVRPMKGFGLADHVRISIGLPEENERFIKALGGILAKRSGAR
jgi:histidinol-phosphate aminotransferase